jgi:hypothetical protein
MASGSSLQEEEEEEERREWWVKRKKMKRRDAQDAESRLGEAVQSGSLDAAE